MYKSAINNYIKYLPDSTPDGESAMLNKTN